MAGTLGTQYGARIWDHFQGSPAGLASSATCVPQTVGPKPCMHTQVVHQAAAAVAGRAYVANCACPALAATALVLRNRENGRLLILRLNLTAWPLSDRPENVTNVEKSP